MPEFIPRPDQVDFSNARWAPVVNCVVRFEGKILLIERSKELNFYPGFWNGISGFLDDHRSLEEKVKEELEEELGLKKEEIIQIQLGAIFDQDEPEYKKTWIVHPVLVDVSRGDVVLDWEGERFEWVSLEDVKNYKLLPGFDRVLSALFGSVAVKI